MISHHMISTLLVALASLGPATAMFGSGTAEIDEAIDVKDRYIVTFLPNISEAVISSHLSWAHTMHSRSLNRRDTTGFEDRLDVGDNFHAYIGHYDEATVEELRNSPEVAYVEEDAIVSIAAVKTQNGATWALHSMANRDAGDKMQYFYHESAGKGTYAYVIDNGIDIMNPEFEGRAEFGWTARDGKVTDPHGTGVAGLIASKTFGVAKKGNLVAVQVFRGGEGSVSDVLRGLQWAVKNATRTPGRKGRSVINLSVGAPVRMGDKAWGNLVKAAVREGVPVVVSAGNDDMDAREWTPANSPHAITVGGIDKDWNRWPLSNYGPSVDVHAPAQDVVSVGLGGKLYKDSGTSFSSPLVAGLVMQLLGKDIADRKTLSSPESLKRRIVEMSTKDKIKDMKPGTPNRIAFNGGANQ